MQFTFKEHGKVVKQLPLDEILEVSKPVTKQVNDPLEDAIITYKAVPLAVLLKKIYGRRFQQSEGLLFICSDGFQSFVPKEDFRNAQAFLAFERIGQASFSLVNKHEANKLIPLAPFYLIWETSKAGSNEEWAYQIVGVDLINFGEHFPQTAPPANSPTSVKRGFIAFTKRCISCHTINGDGGGKAPELNYPVNVTEYYNEYWLRRWIAQPTDVRFSTSMPSLSLPAEERDAAINDLIAYLKAMAKNKRQPY